MENEILLIIKNLIREERVFKALRIALNYRQDSRLQYDIDSEVIMTLLEKRKFVIALRYIERYFKKSDLESKIFKELCNDINYKVRIKELFYVRSVLNSALKKLRLDKKRKNILLNELEKANNDIVLKSYPRILEIGLTGNCNLRCKMCSLSYSEDYRNKQLTQQQVKQIIDFIQYAEIVIWIGGEPLLYKNFESLMDITHSFNTQQEIFTNALLLNENIAKKIVDYNIKLFISIDSVDKEIYENIRTGANFNSLVKNISFISNYRKLKKAKSELVLGAVLSKWNSDNKSNFIDILNFANRYGFTGVNINVDNQEKDIELRDQYIKKFNLNREEIINLAKKYSIKLEILVPEIKLKENKVDNKKCDNQCETNTNVVSLPNIEEKKETYINDKFCIVPWKKLYINFDSNVRINCDCPNVGTFSEVELTKDFLFNNIWNGNEMKKYREKIVNNDLKYISKVCSHMSEGEKHLRE